MRGTRRPRTQVRAHRGRQILSGRYRSHGKRPGSIAPPAMTQERSTPLHKERMTPSAPTIALAAGFRVHWYEIERVLGQGGFGITYLARDSNLDRAVAVKEYFPAACAYRRDDGGVVPHAHQADDFAWGLKRFIEEGRTLAQFEHPAIVRVLSVFEDNDTAYMVMRFEEGQPLSALLKQSALDEQRLLDLTLALVDGLAKVHAAGFIHRDIKPANVYVRADGSPVLLDFGSARQALGSHTQTLTSMVSPGYAPFEQYMSDASQQGPWTDIYALGAMLYCAVCGQAPMAAIDRSKTILHGAGDFLVPARERAGNRYSATFLAAIDHALAFHERDRPQDLQAWREELCGEREPWSAAAGMASAGDSPTAEWPATVVLDEPVTVVRDDVTAVNDGVATTQRLPVTDTTAAGPAPPPRRHYVIAAMIAVLGVFAVFALLPGRDTDAAQVEALLAAARRDVLAGRLTEPVNDNAYAKFRDVLALDSDNPAAVKGIEDIAVDLIRRARKSAREQDWPTTFRWLDTAAAVDPSNPHPLRIKSRLAAMLEERKR